MGERCTVEGTVQHVIFQNEENGYTVLGLLTEEGELVTVVGCIPCVAPGEKLTADGLWVSHPSYGQQFAAETVERLMPETEEELISYLSSGIIKGVGPATAERLVERFGGETLAVIEEEPERLSTVKGITSKRAMEISAAFRELTGLRRVMEFLARYELPVELAMRLYRTYGADALPRLRADPYLLAGERYGVAFADVDEIALSMGFGGDSPCRTEAAVLYELEYNLGNGHVFLPRPKLLAATEQLIGAPPELVEQALDTLESRGAVVEEQIARVDACYLRRMYLAESETARRLLALRDAPRSQGRGVEKLIREMEEQQGIAYAPQQRQAVELAARTGVLLLTGGPGTGKTTSTRGIVALFEGMGLQVLLLAPTGRAAKRMSELCRREAQTIHRALGMTYNELTGETVFKKNGKEPLEADAVIVDEMSMVDLPLMQALLEAVKPGCRLVMVGDGGVPSGGAFRHHPQCPRRQQRPSPGAWQRPERLLFPVPPGPGPSGADGGGPVPHPPAGQHGHPRRSDSGAVSHPPGPYRHREPEPGAAGSFEPPCPGQAPEDVGGADLPGGGSGHADPQQLRRSLAEGRRRDGYRHLQRRRGGHSGDRPRRRAGDHPLR